MYSTFDVKDVSPEINVLKQHKRSTNLDLTF